MTFHVTWFLNSLEITCDAQVQSLAQEIIPEVLKPSLCEHDKEVWVLEVPDLDLFVFNLTTL